MKFVSEIFGYKTSYKDLNKTRQEYFCEFKGTGCDPVNKKSNLTDDEGKLLLEHPTGACSVFYKNTHMNNYQPIIICPWRFEEKNSKNEIIIFNEIKNFLFPDNEIIVLREFGLRTYGRADFMMCSIDEERNLLNYLPIEFQADATTGTRGVVKCVKDFFTNKSININYEYGMNTKASIKGFSLQMIDKGNCFMKLKKDFAWVIQDNLVESFLRTYGLKLEEVESKKTDGNYIYIFQVKLHADTDSNKYKLLLDKVLCTSPNEIQNGMNNKEPLDESWIIEQIQNKL